MRAPYVDYTGHKFGTLTVIGSIRRTDRYYWECRCECGNIRFLSGNNLVRAKSCGCLQRKNITKSLYRSIFNDYKNRAKLKGLKFDLTHEFFYELIQKTCFYCNAEPRNIKSRYGMSVNYNGLDRINSDLGYIYNNVRICCTICNTMKMNFSEQEFAKQIEILYTFYVKRGQT